MLLDLAIPPTWFVANVFFAIPQLGAQEPDNAGRRRPRDHAGRVNCPEKHTSAASNGELGGGQRLPGEAGDALDEETFHIWRNLKKVPSCRRI